jgi:hypothetical protein
MKKAWIPVVCLAAYVAGTARAQSLPVYLDLSRSQVRGEKSKEYEDAIHKIIEVNRKYKGDRWIALTTEYGETGTYLFSSSRDSMAAIETGGDAFMKAIKEGMGPLGDKMMRDLGAWSTFRSELRRRRWDLSVHPPTDAAGLATLVGQSRWIRTLRLDVRPGWALDYVQSWKGFQHELEKVSPPVTALVSESVTGTPAIFVGVYYKSMADMDVEVASVQKALTSTAYLNLSKVTASAVDKSMWEIHRVRPDLSNPPDEVLNADPAFWKPAPPAKPKGELLKK